MIQSRQLECFEAVARHLHFTRAAKELNVAQPALSQQVRRLEREIAADLFVRDRHHVALTPAGEALYAHAQRILADMASVTEEMLGWAGLTTGRVRLGVARALAARLATLLAAFAAEYPGVDIELREENTADMLAGLHAGSLDAATIAAPPSDTDDRLALLSLGREPLVLIVAEDHPFAKRRTVAVGGLDGRELVQYRAGSAIRDIIVQVCAAAGVVLHARYEMREYATARAMTSVGLATAIVPLSIANEPGLPVHVVRLRPEPSWAPALAWSCTRRPSPALAAFIAFGERHMAMIQLASSP